MCQLTIATPGHDSVQQAVHAAREYALRNPEAWANALHDLSQAAENDIVFACMDGDEAHAGQRLIHWLRERLLEDATDRVKDEIAELEVES
jgi:hypothetical protein